MTLEDELKQYPGYSEVESVEERAYLLGMIRGHAFGAESGPAAFQECLRGLIAEILKMQDARKASDAAMRAFWDENVPF